MTTEMEKKMIGAFYALTEEKANWEKDLIASNRRNMDLQYIVDDQADQIATLKADNENNTNPILCRQIASDQQFIDSLVQKSRDAELVAAHQYLDLQQICDDLDKQLAALEDAGIPMGDNEQPQDIITAIELLAGQIATLKVALRHALFAQKWTGARGIEPEDIERQVAAQLAREYPEIFGGIE